MFAGIQKMRCREKVLFMAVVVSVEDCGDCSAVAADGGEKQFEVEAALRVVVLTAIPSSPVSEDSQ